MEHVITNIVVAGISAVFAGSITYILNAQNLDNHIMRIAKEISMEQNANHEKQEHKDSMYDHVEHELKKHKVECGLVIVNELKETSGRLDRVTRALIWLVSAQGGNLKDLDLD